ncbi:MAG TPA: HisA/HisF-related TIM barrel protein [Terrimesophilobacter sp.]|nr:HisA/HisF-related TIM barrel protein [Terrimesophilobacter sp.]
MAKRRVIPTLLTDGVSLVKGEQFRSWRTVGSVVAAARVFSMRDVDELVLLDVMATRESRCISPAMVSSVARCMSVPLAVGGGVKTLAEFEATLRAGADKVVIGSAAVRDLAFITAASHRFGAQAVVVSVDSVSDDGNAVAIDGGVSPVEMSPVALAIAAVAAGAGEILLQSIHRDGLQQGMDLELIHQVSTAVPVPVIASSGAGNYEHLLQALRAGADAVSAGAMFQFTEQTPRGARNYLAGEGIAVRMAN